MSKAIYVDLDFVSVSRILNLPGATTSSEPVTLAQMQAAIASLSWKDNVRSASTANLTLSGPGTAIDGVTMSVNDRVLVKDQTDATQNGIYIFNGDAAAMTRAVDASSFDELENAIVIVDEGTSNDGTSWRQTQVNGTLGVDDVLFDSFLATSPDASESVKGVAELATQAEVDAGTDDTTIITPLKLKNSKWFDQSKVFTIGDGSSTSFNCDHNLNTRNVQVGCYRNSGSYEDVMPEITRPTVNRVTVGFTAAPGSSAFIIVVQGALTA